VARSTRASWGAGNGQRNGDGDAKGYGNVNGHG
jgi:hypothetical protein